MSNTDERNTEHNLPVPAARANKVTVHDAAPLFDTATFAHMADLARGMVRASMLSESLQVFRDRNGRVVKAGAGEFDPEGTFGNCLMVVNKARAWGLDPMSVAECMSVVRGKPCYEGKLIAAVIDARLGIKLKYEWIGEPRDPNYGIKAWDPNDPSRSVDGTVKRWKTEQWGNDPEEYRKRLKYRADREWCRMWEPALILGVYSEDEMAELAIDARARRASPIQNREMPKILQVDGPVGFDPEHIAREIGDAPSTQPGPELGSDSDTGPGQHMEETRHSETTSNHRNGNPAGDSTGQEGAKPSPEHDSESASEDAVTGRAVGNTVPPSDAGGASLTPKLLTNYSKALHRATKKESLKAAATAFWRSEGKSADQFSERARGALKKIWEAHEERVAGTLQGPALEKRVRSILEQAQ